MTQTHRRTKVFVSYSHEDSSWLEDLRPHLGSLARESERACDIWDDSRIATGAKWREEIEAALSSAKVAVLLVSKYFLDSEFIVNNELPALLSAAKKEGAVILPVILSPCRYRQSKNLSPFQSLNSPSETLEQMSKVEREKLWVELTVKIDEALNAAPQSTPPSEPPPPSSHVAMPYLGMAIPAELAYKKIISAQELGGNEEEPMRWHQELNSLGLGYRTKQFFNGFLRRQELSEVMGAPEYKWKRHVPQAQSLLASIEAANAEAVDYLPAQLKELPYRLKGRAIQILLNGGPGLSPFEITQTLLHSYQFEHSGLFTTITHSPAIFGSENHAEAVDELHQIAQYLGFSRFDRLFWIPE